MWAFSILYKGKNMRVRLNKQSIYCLSEIQNKLKLEDTSPTQLINTIIILLSTNQLALHEASINENQSTRAS